jgi:hypothetical protein
MLAALLGICTAFNSGDLRLLDKIYEHYMDRKVYFEGLLDRVEGLEAVKEHTILHPLRSMPDAVLTIANVTTKQSRITAKLCIRGTKQHYDASRADLCSVQTLPEGKRRKVEELVARGGMYEFSASCLVTLITNSRRTKFVGVEIDEWSSDAVECFAEGL